MKNNSWEFEVAIKNSLYQSRLMTIARSTLCLYTDDPKSELKAVGSAVLINYKQETFLLTAAHVLHGHLKDTYVLIDDKAITIGGLFRSSPLPPDSDRTSDKIDLVVVKLDAAFKTEVLPWYEPVDEKNIIIPHTMEDRYSYFFYGFPLTRTKKVWNEDRISSEATIYQGASFTNFNYEKFGLSPIDHCAVHFDGKVQSTKISQVHLSPDLTGMSGSGMWHLHPKDALALVGIVIERINLTNFKSIIAVRIEKALKMMEHLLAFTES